MFTNITKNEKFSEQVGRLQHWTLKLELKHSRWNGIDRWIGFVPSNVTEKSCYGF